MNSNDQWKPQIFDPSNTEDVAQMQRLEALGKIWRKVDTLESQLNELFKARAPAFQRRGDDTFGFTIENLIGYGRWVYYPWSGELVRVLPEPEFHELRLNRNHLKITEAEQKKLASARIGIVGLSVGNAVAQTLALEGLFGELRIADFDEIELSNFNRIQGKVSELLLSKVYLCARRIFEQNPYANIVPFASGINEENIDAFLNNGGVLDCLVDECDSIKIKFLLRERARTFRIPVLMETSDRGMLDIERFDLYKDLPLFHGLVEPRASSTIPAVLSDEDKVSLALPIIGSRTMSARLAASMVEIRESISTWPQLGSDVILGGAITAMAVRNLLLNRPIREGRFYVDVEADLFRGSEASHGAEIDSDPGRFAGMTRAAAGMTEAKTVTPVSEANGRGLIELPTFIADVIEKASRAPSGGNMQPWLFQYKDEKLWIAINPEKSSHLDVDFDASCFAIGAAIRNCEVAAAKHGYVVVPNYLPAKSKNHVVACLSFSPDGKAKHGVDPAYENIEKRFTYRTQASVRLPLDDATRRRLVDTLDGYGVAFEFIEAEEEIASLASIIGLADRLRFLCPLLYEEMMAEMCWSSEEAMARRDGIDINTLALTAGNTEALKIMRRREILDFLRQMNLGRSLKKISADLIKTSSALVLVSAPRQDQAQVIKAGVATQDLWLRLTEQQIGMHPMTAIIYMFRLIENSEVGFHPKEKEELLLLKEQFNAFFPKSIDLNRLFLFRLAKLEGATVAKSLRYPLPSILRSNLV